jgi:hypothetical protein
MALGVLAKIISHDVQRWKVGIQIDHPLAPFLANWVEKLPAKTGYLSFQLLSISQQTFNYGSSTNRPPYFLQQSQNVHEPVTGV